MRRKWEWREFRQQKLLLVILIFFSKLVIAIESSSQLDLDSTFIPSIKEIPTELPLESPVVTPTIMPLEKETICVIENQGDPQPGELPIITTDVPPDSDYNPSLTPIIEIKPTEQVCITEIPGEPQPGESPIIEENHDLITPTPIATIELQVDPIPSPYFDSVDESLKNQNFLITPTETPLINPNNEVEHLPQSKTEGNDFISKTTSNYSLDKYRG